MRHRSVALLCLVVTALAACGSLRGDRVVDTWPVGPVSQCIGQEAARCDALVAAGLRGLDERDPGHPTVVTATLHAEGAYADPRTGDVILMQRSGSCCQVLVVTLTDGSQAAIGVGFPGISQTAVAVPWECLPDATPASPVPAAACGQR